MSPEEDHIRRLEAELLRLRSVEQNESQPGDCDRDGVVLNLPVRYEVGTAAKWRPAKKKKVDVERLIWGTSRKRGLRWG